ncbi:hypothetical protein [Tropicimonas sp. S265A]|uniref:hypothetical protein n=1 Tax=Tropicimonas sp. S265A TaxID=3415134 RepID=UPI003C7A1A4B
MSNPESFIDEVSEEVRRDRLYGAFRKYGWIAGLLVVLIVGGAAYNEWQKAQARADAQGFGDALYAALEMTEIESRLIALEDVRAPDGAEPLSALIYATEVQARSTEEAVAALQALAAVPDTPAVYVDLARLRMVMIGGDVLTTAERSAALDTLIQGSGPFRLLALEQRALIEAETGQRDAAIETLQRILGAAGATEGMRTRVLQLIVALGGDVAQG